jgi:ParB-like chromosome segregation protein Spo0J
MTTEPNLPVVIWDIKDLKPFPKNVKVHSEEQIASLANSIRRFGWTQPIVVDRDGVIIAGHGRRLAALLLGLEKIPVVVRVDLTKLEADMLRISDNKVSSTEYDMTGMREEMLRISDGDLKLWEGLGFTEHELSFEDLKLGEMDEQFFAEDVLEAVEEQKRENAESAKKIDEQETPIIKAFGFSKVTVAEARRINKFMITIEGESGKKGVEALIAHFDNMGYDE